MKARRSPAPKPERQRVLAAAQAPADPPTIAVGRAVAVPGGSSDKVQLSTAFML
jgi:hypothetical protein